MLFRQLLFPLSIASAVCCYHLSDPSQPTKTQSTKAPLAAEIYNDTSVVPGKGFNRVAIIWLENTDYSKAHDNPDMEWLATQGIVLSNYYALTHPSQPNYMASVGGDLFGNTNDNFKSLPSTVASIVDILESKGISWAEYQEDMPYSGFKGDRYPNKETFANDYVRKHNPLIMYDSVSNDRNRLGNIKTFGNFKYDLEHRELPQWMFITPNVTNDGHDSTINVAASWSRGFLAPLLQNEYFMKDTLVLLTFDENENYVLKNQVYALLLGGAIDSLLHGTVDDTVYTHYSQLSTVEANWDLPNLGRNDVNNDGYANVFKFLADKIGYINKDVDTSHLFNNVPRPGYFSIPGSSLPDINCTAIGVGGRGVLDTIAARWCS